VQTKWQTGHTERNLGTLAAGQYLSIVGQIKFGTQPVEGKDLVQLCLPPGYDLKEGFKITVALKGDRLPQKVGDEFESVTLWKHTTLMPVCRDEKQLQFDQSQHKWRLRLAKQKSNLLCVVTDIYNFLNEPNHFGGYGGRQLSRLMQEYRPQLNALVLNLNNVCQDIAKDRLQELCDRIQQLGLPDKEADERTEEEQTAICDQYYYPEPIEVKRANGTKDLGLTNQYNALARDARVLQFYLQHPSFCDEAAAKAQQFTRPEKETEEVQPVFTQLAMTPALAAHVYHSLFGCTIDKPLPPDPADVPPSSSTAEGAVASAPAIKPLDAHADTVVPAAPVVAAADAVVAADAEEKKQKAIERFKMQSLFKRFYEAQQKKPVYCYQYDLLMLIVHAYLSGNLAAGKEGDQKPVTASQEVEQKAKQEAQANIHLARARYLKRTRAKADSAVPANGQVPPPGDPVGAGEGEHQVEGQPPGVLAPASPPASEIKDGLAAPAAPVVVDQQQLPPSALMRPPPLVVSLPSGDAGAANDNAGAK